MVDGHDIRGAGRSFVTAGLLLGVGLGGFIDGIVAHQLLEWHHLLSGWYPLVTEHNIRVNMVGDGFFHLGCLVVTIAGVAMLNRSAGTEVRHRGRRLTGLLLAGWGAFNLVEGLIDHQLLGAHHVRSGPHELAYDLGFLASGAVLLGVGLLISRTRPRRHRKVMSS
jgi:uncharacterized membrane protein